VSLRNLYLLDENIGGVGAQQQNKSMVQANDPRDRYVQYQEHLTRQLEGDVVDTSGEDKVRVELQQVDASRASVPSPSRTRTTRWATC
jgi:hypothetical protein